MKEREVKFKITTIKNGQARPYADTEKEFIVEDLSEPMCPHDLFFGFGVSLVPKRRFKDSPCPFDSTEDVVMVENRKIKCTQTIPSTH